MKVCVLGDSHGGAFKRAWDEIGSTFPDTQLTFFCARRRNLEDLHVRDGLLLPVSKRLKRSIEFTSGGLGFVDLKQYDAVLMIGCMAHYADDEDTLRLSKAVIRQVVIGEVKTSLALELVERIRELSAKPVYLAAKPLLALAEPSDAPSNMQPYLDLIAMIQQQVFEPHDCVIVPQPEATIVDSFNTRAEFAVGSVTLDTGRVAEHADGELKHMNLDYGKAFLTACLAAMSENPLLQKPVPPETMRPEPATTEPAN